jgi:hypothetical protein
MLTSCFSYVFHKFIFNILKEKLKTCLQVQYSKTCTENDCANTVASAKPIAPTVRILFSITLKFTDSGMYN